jgi:xanthine dehydrogenase accessory factor
MRLRDWIAGSSTPCGGHLTIVVEPLAPDAEQTAVFDEIVARLDARECTLREVELRPDARSRVRPVPVHEPLRLAPGADGTDRLRQVYGPRHHLFLIGAGMVSRYLAEMALALNYDVTVCDPREEMLAQWAVPGTTALCAMPDDAIREHADDVRTAIVALTHDPRIDDMGLLEALETRAFYVGAMGSSRTSEKRRARLRELGVSETALSRLHAPVGLPIGSKTPPEIAVAILAELTRVVRTAATEREAVSAAG